MIITADDLTLVTLKLASKGYYCGDPEKVRQANCQDVLRVLDYMSFVSNYETQDYLINKGD